MAQLLTPSSSFRSDNFIDLTAADKGDLTTVYDDDIIAKNRMTILELEEKYILTPGIVTIAPSGELKVDLSHEEPDQGTMAGLYPTLPPPEELKHQIPSWLRDYLLKELNLFGHGPPFACGSLYDQMQHSKEMDMEGNNLSVRSTVIMMSGAIVSLRDSIVVLRDFCSSGEALYEEIYTMEFGIVESVVRKLAGCDATKSIKEKLLASAPRNYDKESSPSKRRKVSEGRLVEIAHDSSAASKELPADIGLLIDLGSQGMAMKSALDSSLEDLVITPVSRLVEKLEVIHKGLCKQEEEHMKAEAHVAQGDHSSDSGVSACSP
ncbi:hypothetical protein J7T55_011777 [Diaporthe amygdali]|uniref:uncharacterized protein n=1 Tax=Phomopsis amygdali TaxID=1214568 RepID=UPI0022FDC931|nr:uncharacterized protein J7T55_011777 [Diaporthe amygdali]KAJ0123312.1 hypothetical protein J7T55_011777 [Diaporthe amygdali]